MGGGKVTKEATIKVRHFFFVKSYFFRYFWPTSNELLGTVLKFVTVTSDALLFVARSLPSKVNFDDRGENCLL